MRMGAEKNDGQAVAARDFAHHGDSVHAWHFEIQSDDMRLQLGDFFQAEGAVHGGADDFDGAVALEDLRNELPHESGIVDDENANRLAHAMAPSAGARPI